METPHSVQLVESGGRLHAAAVHSYWEDRRSHGPLLFVTDYEHGWAEPRVAFDPAPDHVAEVFAPVGDPGTGHISWSTGAFGLDVDDQQLGRRLEWGVVDDDSMAWRSIVTQMSSFSGPAAVLVSGSPVWLVRDGISRERLRVYVADGNTAVNAGVIRTPLLNFTTVAVPLSDGRIVSITGGPDTTTGANPPFASYFTDIAVDCSV